MHYRQIGRYIDIDTKGLDVKTVSDFLEIIPSRRMRHIAITEKWIYLNDAPAKANDLLKGHLRINLYPYENDATYIEPVDVLYEDELVLVVRKPAHLLVHDDGGKEATLTSIVNGYLALSNAGPAFAIHRLDYLTEGLVLFSKSPLFQSYFDVALANRKIERSYMAIVSGRIARKLTIDKPIGRDRHNPQKQRISKTGKAAKTTIIPIKKTPSYTVLECHIATGRRHQIRVHLASIGHPILNDPLYGEESSILGGMGLLAYELRFPHPLKEEEIRVSLPLPKAYEDLL